jgi:hypothetical protein
MRLAVALSCVLALSGCGPKVAAVAVPTAGLDKAAYCAAVTLVQDRDEQFPEAAIQYLLLGSMEGEKLNEPQYARLAHLAGTYGTKLEASGDPGSGPACLAAYPMTNPAKTFQLPSDPNERLFGCDGLLDTLAVSLGPVDPPRMNQASYDYLAGSLYKAMTTAMKADHLSLKQAEALRSRMTPVMLSLGNSYKVLQACRAAYPPQVQAK